MFHREGKWPFVKLRGGIGNDYNGHLYTTHSKIRANLSSKKVKIQNDYSDIDINFGAFSIPLEPPKTCFLCKIVWEKLKFQFFKLKSVKNKEK